MRAPLLGTIAFFALTSASILACTFIVDGEFSDFSGTCKIQGIGNNVCGQCIAKKCQAKIDPLCENSSVTFNLSDCVQDPSVTSNSWACSGLVGDAALHEPGIAQNVADLRNCIGGIGDAGSAGGCMTECMTCTEVDAGATPCGACIMTNCGSLLNGSDGCCDNSGIRDDISTCSAKTNPDCSGFTDTVNRVIDAGVPDGSDAGGIVFRSCSGFEGTSEEFSKCVVDHCTGTCPL